MALSFPLAPETFFGGLRVADSTFHLPASLAMSRTRGGAITSARLAERLWTGQIKLPLQYHAVAAATDALVSVLSEPGRSFFAHPVPNFAPFSDPSGTILGASTPTIHTLAAGGRELRITGLPAGYVLSAGDFLSFSYGSSPTRYALHQVVSVSTADGAGLTPLTEVTPPIRSGAVTGAAVTLVRPFIEAVLIPGAPARSRRVFTEGLTLDFVQTLG